MEQIDKERLKIKAYEIVRLINTAKNRQRKITKDEFLYILDGIEQANLERFLSAGYVRKLLDMYKSQWKSYKPILMENLFFDIQLDHPRSK